MPRFFNTPKQRPVDTGLPEHWLDGKYSAEMTKSHLAVLALGTASGMALFAGLSAFATGIPVLALACFGGAIFGLARAQDTIDRLKSWQWLDRKKAHECELDLVELKTEHAGLRYQYGVLSELVRQREDEEGLGDEPSADVVSFRRPN